MNNRLAEDLALEALEMPVGAVPTVARGPRLQLQVAAWDLRIAPDHDDDPYRATEGWEIARRAFYRVVSRHDALRGLGAGLRRLGVRRRCGCERRPGTRRTASRSAGGGSSGDDGPEPEPALAGQHEVDRHHRAVVA